MLVLRCGREAVAKARLDIARDHLLSTVVSNPKKLFRGADVRERHERGLRSRRARRCTRTRWRREYCGERGALLNGNDGTHRRDHALPGRTPSREEVAPPPAAPCGVLPRRRNVRCGDITDVHDQLAAGRNFGVRAVQKHDETVGRRVEVGLRRKHWSQDPARIHARQLPRAPRRLREVPRPLLSQSLGETVKVLIRLHECFVGPVFVAVDVLVVHRAVVHVDRRRTARQRDPRNPEPRARIENIFSALYRRRDQIRAAPSREEERRRGVKHRITSRNSSVKRSRHLEIAAGHDSEPLSGAGERLEEIGFAHRARRGADRPPTFKAQLYAPAPEEAAAARNADHVLCVLRRLGSAAHQAECDARGDGGCCCLHVYMLLRIKLY